MGAGAGVVGPLKVAEGSWSGCGGEIVGGGWRLGVIGLKAFGGAISHVSGKDLSVPSYKGRVIR